MNGHFVSGTTLLPLLVVAVLTISGCRKTHDQPTDDLSDEQQKLSMVMNALVDTAHASVLLSIELGKIIHEISPDDSSSELFNVFNRQLDSAALQLSSRFFMETDVRQIIDAVSGQIFTQWNIAFNSDRDNLRYLFPHLVVAGKQGSCVGMSLLYLLFAEKLGLPLYGVLAPGHLFVRYDNGKERINIETLRKGEAMSDGWYRERWSIRDTGLYTLGNLSAAGVLAVVHYNLGTIYMARKENGKALEHLQKATTLLPDFPEALGNLALVVDAQGNPAKALALLETLHRAHPTLEKIDENLASLQLKCARYIDALSTYSQLSRSFPDNPHYFYGCGVALFNLGRTEEAVEALQNAVARKPDYPEARQLLEQVGK